ncbi:hypothetical protein B9479_003670 [Cryptococcus floricola]|uniref:Uncharacterized protein n=1 Tax=Cryptococcus floricola TaxID=2591691 RepID=A0A5D3AXX9_9TREE|nr:hypothetical protein B9479_003670 [Cryptococcus floricola]
MVRRKIKTPQEWLNHGYTLQPHDKVICNTCRGSQSIAFASTSTHEKGKGHIAAAAAKAARAATIAEYNRQFDAAIPIKLPSNSMPRPLRPAPNPHPADRTTSGTFDMAHEAAIARNERIQAPTLYTREQIMADAEVEMEQMRREREERAQGIWGHDENEIAFERAGSADADGEDEDAFMGTGEVYTEDGGDEDAEGEDEFPEEQPSEDEFEADEEELAARLRAL